MFTKRSKAPVQETPRPPVWAGGAPGVRKRAVRAWDWSNERVKDTLHSMAFLGPSVTGVLVFFIVPFLVVCYYSVIRSPSNPEFVFLDNFKAVLKNSS